MSAAPAPAPADAPTRPLPPPLDEVRRQVEALRQRAAAVLDGLDAAQLHWRPAPERWSIAQCFRHLAEVDRIYLRGAARAIDEARRRGATGDRTPRFNLVERWFLRALEPPPRRRFPAPRPVWPTADEGTAENLLATFRARCDEHERLLADADGLDLHRLKMASPFASWLRFRVAAAFAILAAHDRRHLWQAEQVRRHGDFPRPAAPDAGPPTA